MGRRGLLLAASVAGVVWIGALVSAPLVAARQEAAPQWQRMPAALVYLGASFICHQRPERSHHLYGVPLPVCARCTGLHLGGVIGLLALLVTGRAWRARLMEHVRLALCLAVLPTAMSLLVEWLGGGSPLVSRTVTALPAGAIAGALVGLTVFVAPPRAAGRLVGRTAAPDPAAPAGR